MRSSCASWPSGREPRDRLGDLRPPPDGNPRRTLRSHDRRERGSHRFAGAGLDQRLTHLATETERLLGRLDEAFDSRIQNATALLGSRNDDVLGRFDERLAQLEAALSGKGAQLVQTIEGQAQAIDRTADRLALTLSESSGSFARTVAERADEIRHAIDQRSRGADRSRRERPAGDRRQLRQSFRSRALDLRCPDRLARRRPQRPRCRIDTSLAFAQQTLLAQFEERGSALTQSIESNVARMEAIIGGAEGRMVSGVAERAEKLEAALAAADTQADDRFQTRLDRMNALLAERGSAIEVAIDQRTQLLRMSSRRVLRRSTACWPTAPSGSSPTSTSETRR